MSTYSDVESAPTNREPFMTIIRWTTLITLTLAVSLASADLQSYLSGVPDYYWYYGCSPTSGGELIGYWDNQPGYGNLYHGTAPMYAGSGYQAIDEMISSTEHNAATFNGAECTHDNSPPAGDTGPNSVACFMHTDPSDGDSYEWNIATGMRRYAAYDDPDTSTNESMDFHSFVYYAPYAGWSSTWNAAAFTFEDLMYEVDAGHPMMLNLSLDGGGHSVVAYGYWERDDGSRWFAVRDTWQDGISDGAYGVAAIGDSGQEWWRWEENEAGEQFGYAYYVDDAIFFVPNDRGPITAAGTWSDPYAIDHQFATIEGSLGAAGEEDWYMVYLGEGERLVATTQDDEGDSSSIDTEILVVEPTLSQGWTYDGFWSGYTNTDYAMRQADQEGWWRVGVRGSSGSETGDYVLTLYHSEAPEPGTLALMGMGLAALVAWRRRRRAIIL